MQQGPGCRWRDDTGMAADAGTGRMDNHWCLVGDNCGRRPGGRRFSPGEEVGSG